MSDPVSHPPRLAYRADIDGLRAVAILAVVLFHAKLGFKGGFVGVDVFFVISGYLITGMLMKEMQTGPISLTDFWERRIRRIFPALAVMVAAVLTASFFLLLPDALTAAASSAVAQAGMVANVHFWAVSDYFASAAEESPLLHAWSLAVEEQFYLLLPLLLLLLGRQTTSGQALRKRVSTWLIALLILSFIVGSITTFTAPTFAFYWLPPRAWELLIGSLLAARPAHWFNLPQRWRSPASWAGIASIGVAALAYDSGTPFPGFAALLPCLGAAFLLLSQEPTHHAALPCGAGRWLSSWPMVFIGKLSYSLYLWHWPLLAFATYLTVVTDKPPLTLRLGLLMASLALAWISWRWVETPVRQRRILGSQRSLFTAAALITILTTTAACLLWFNQGWPSRLPASALAYMAPDAQATALFRDRAEPPFSALGAANAPSVRVLVWGDSHAGRVVPAIHEACLKEGSSALAAIYSASSPTLGYYRKSRHGLNERTQAWAEHVVRTVREQRIPHTLLVGYWQKMVGKNSQAFTDALIQTVHELREAGTEVWILLDVPNQPFEVDQALALHALHPSWFPNPIEQTISPEQHRRDNRTMYDLIPALKAAGAHVLDPLPHFLVDDSTRTRIEADSEALYTDAHHLSRAGARRLQSVLAPIFSTPLSRHPTSDGAGR